MASKIKEDKKSFFAYARHKSKAGKKLGAVKNKDGIRIEEPGEMAEEFNRYFASVFTDEDQVNIPQPEMVYKGRKEDEINEVLISVQNIRHKLQSLRIDKSAGPDEIEPKLLKSLSDEVGWPIAHILQKSLDEGEVPDDWKRSNIRPIYKKG